MSLDSRDRFTNTVDDYDRYRPDYPDALYDWVAEVVPPPAVAVDLGAGTGISTRQLAERGWRAIGVEPNPAMRERAESHGGTYVEGQCDATGLESGSARLIFGAQAWHWFELGPTLAECRRVLDEGWCVAAWNLRLEVGLGAAYDGLLRHYSTDFKGVPKGPDTIANLRARAEVKAPEEGCFEHGQWLDRAGLIGRCFSSSYVRHGVVDPEGLRADLEALFEVHAVEGRVRLAYETRALRRTPGP